MSGLTAAEAIDLIKNDPSQYATPEALRTLASQVSVDATGKVTVLYSGTVGGGISSGDLIKAMVSQGEDIRVIDKTPAAEFLNSRTYQEAVARVFDTTVDEVLSNRSNPGNQFLFEPKAGIWAETSMRFVVDSAGDIRTITPFADGGRTFAQVELPRLLELPDVKSINGVPKEVFQAIYEKTSSLVEVNKAVSAVSSTLVGNMDLSTSGDAIVKVNSTGLFKGATYEGTSVPVDEINVSLKVSINQSLTGENASSLGEGWRNLGIGAKAVALAEGTAKGLGVLGVAATAYRVANMTEEAQAAYEQGDTQRAAKILTNGSLEISGGWAGGLAASSFAAGFFSPLLPTGPVGDVAYIVLVTGAGIGGAVFGENAVKSLLDGISRGDSNVTMDGDWKVTSFGNGTVVREWAGPSYEGAEFEPGSVSIGGKWVQYSKSIITKNDDGTFSEQNIGRSGVLTRVFSENPLNASPGEILSQSYFDIQNPKNSGSFTQDGIFTPYIINASKELIGFDTNGDAFRVNLDSNNFSATVNGLTGRLGGKSITVTTAGGQTGSEEAIPNVLDILPQAISNLATSSGNTISSNSSFRTTSYTATVDDGNGGTTVMQVQPRLGADGSYQGQSIIQSTYVNNILQSNVMTTLDAYDNRQSVFDGMVGDRHVRISFEFEDNGKARVTDAAFVSANGQLLPPDDRAALLADLNYAGVTPDTLIYANNTLTQLRNGDSMAGVSDSEVGYGAIDPETGQAYGVSIAKTIGAAIAGNDPTMWSWEKPSETLSNVSDALSLISAIQKGEPLPIVASGLHVAYDLSGDRNLAGASSVASGVLSLMSLDNALKNGDYAMAITAGAQAVGAAASAYSAFTQQSTEIGNFLNGGPGVGTGALPFIGMVNDLIHGDYVSLAVDIAAYFVPVVGQVYAIFNVVTSLFDSEPDPWGTGRYVWNGTGVTVSSQGETGGNEAVAGFMNNILASMNSMIAEVQRQNPGSSLGLIPNRMPTLGYGMDGFRFGNIDPLTGIEKNPTLRFDTAGKPYNAPAGSPESFQSLGEAFIRSALAREAIAPMWEVRTAAIQTQYGDPQAGLSEEERAGRAGQLASAETGSTQVFRPVVLDLNGDGIHTMSKDQSGVAFDVDDSGFLKSTGWIKSDDAFLTLDRNYNGHTDSGKELFSNAEVALSRRGLGGMSWVDSNYDGKLTVGDPVFNELRIWRDANGNGAVDDGEQTTLAQNGVTSLNFEMGTFEQNGQLKQMASPDLDADTEGSRATVVPEGIVVESSNGKTSLLVTRVDDLTQVEANRDGLQGYEDIETIVDSSSLLANDTFGGFVGRDLALTSVQNVRHGTAFVDANHFVHFSPEANYSGNGAGFDYVVSAPNGQQGTATVDISLQGTNDAPTTSLETHELKPIYGYTPYIYYDEFGNYSGGLPIYEPYTETLNNDQDYGWNWGQPTKIEHNTPIDYQDTGYGQIAASDPDDPASSLTYKILSQPQWGAATIDASGRFHYVGWWTKDQPSGIGIVGQDTSTGGNYKDAEIRTDAFVVEVSDPHGATTSQTVYVKHYGPYIPPAPEGGGGGCCPIVIDLDRNGFSFTPVDDSKVFFDINSDGWKRKVSWMASGDGMLVYDANGNGRADNGSEISFAKYSPGAQSDLEGLKAFDSNGDGVFSKLDEKWGEFGIWQDANQNGVTDTGEFKTLDEMGVASISLTSNKQFSVVDGDTIQGTAPVAMNDGSTLDAADVTLAYRNEVQVPQLDGSTSVVTTSPFSPSGEEIDGTESNDLLLGKTGNNIVKAGAGNDVVMEDGGNDVIYGGEGDDIIYSGADNDVVLGEAGDDTTFAGLGNDLVIGGDGHDALFGEGGNDVMFGGTGNDLVYGDVGNDVLSGDDGDDQVYGGLGNDAIFGGAGNDELGGNEGYDRLDGGEGNDLLDGGTDADQMLGGAGDDTYVVDDAEDTVLENANEGTDTVRSSISYTLGANVENLTLTGLAHLAGTGNELDNVLIGNGGNNTLTGGAGNDTLNGGIGADTMLGGSGNDVYFVDNAGDTVIENAGEGIDTVKSSISYTLGANVESLVLTGHGAKSATGNALNNRLTGNVADNILDGGAGADVMAGGKGNDTYIVDNAGDQVVEAADEGIDTVKSNIDYALGAHVENLVLTGTAIYATGNEADNLLVGNGSDNVIDGGLGADIMAGEAGNDTYLVDNTGDVVVEQLNEGTDTILSSVDYSLSSNMENLTLTGSAARGTGNQLDNVLIANGLGNSLSGAAGNDTLIGGAGSDQLDGGSGADFMAGHAGSDTYVVDDAGDRVVEQAGEGLDTVLSSIDYALAANVENLTLTGTAIQAAGNVLDNILTANDLGNSLSGAAGNDTLIGGSGNDLLDGGTGADSMAGHAGNDTYIVDNAGDFVVEQVNEGTDVVRSSIDYMLTANVENLALTEGATRGAGNEMDNVLIANDLGNSLSGAAGDDTLIGGTGNDLLDGGLGADAMRGGEGDDLYIVDNIDDQVVEDAGEGIDSVWSGVDYTLTANVENLTLTGSATFGAGNELDNIMTANDLDNRLAGGAGNDALYGGAGADTLDGATGADLMKGGKGDDLYIVDNAGDQVIENANEGTDSVQSSIDYALIANVENLTLTASATKGTGNELDNVITANDLGNTLAGAAGKDTLIGGAGNDLLDGGTGADLLAGGAGDDTYIVDNAGDLVVEQANEGQDTVLSSVDYALTTNVENLILIGSATRGTGNELDNVIIANDLGNTLSGDVGNDTLYGGAGNDLLDGGTGADIMTGGAGNDTYTVGHAGDRVIESLLGGIDTVLSSISYVLPDQVENLTLTGTDNLNGTGNALNNILIGNVGDNILDGAAGADAMAGGAGNDTYIVDNAGDLVVENAGEGNDMVKADIDYTLTANVENLILTGPAMRGTGNELNNVITANDLGNTLSGGAGNDTLNGGEGNDVVDGGTGSDVMQGGKGDDLYIVDNAADVVAENANEGIDSVQSSIDYALTANVENLALTGAATKGTGNALDNILTANDLGNILAGAAGNDTLYGGSGADVLEGGTGADVMKGAKGDDLYIVDDAGDQVTENANEGTDTVQSSIDYALTANVENLMLTGSATKGTGNELDNVITANDLGNTLSGAAGRDTLTGGAGSDLLDGGTDADVMAGHGGDDTYIVDNAGDLVVEQANEGQDTVLSSVDYTLTANVENLILTGAATKGAGNELDNVLTANDLGNALSGSAGNDTLNGGAGNDLLDGGTGADIMTGGAGNDTYVVDHVGDRVFESLLGGIDTVLSSISYVLPDQVENLTLTGTDNLNGTGNELNNILIGNAGDNILDGAAGADAMAGGAGNDTYIVDNAGDLVVENANEGNDTVKAGIDYTLTANVENLILTGTDDLKGSGNELDNIVTGNSGNNILDGGAGADTLIGGGGNDTYIVDNANDIVIENPSDGIDTVKASTSYTLSANVENLILTGTDNINGAGNDLDNTITGNSGNNILTGGTGNDAIDGGTGDDTYVYNWNDGLDTITDTAGNDTLSFGPGLSLDNVAIRVTTVNDVTTAHLRVLDAGGCEQPGQGVDFTITADKYGRYISPIENFRFADGSVKTFDDVLIKTQLTFGMPWNRNITTGRNDDIIYGGSAANTIHSGTGHDIVYAGSRGDTVYGEGGDDYLAGGTGNDLLDGGCGINVLEGSNGDDTLRTGQDNSALLGDNGRDTIVGGAGSDFIAGGQQNDTITTGAGYNVVAFNRGDSTDTIMSSADAVNTLSLGGGIARSDLSFVKSGTDLVLSAGRNDSVVFKDWYANANNRNFVTLQMIEEAAPDYNPWSKDVQRNQRIETFDFLALAQKFDRARAANPYLTKWSLMNGMLDAYQGGSDTAALGGDLAYQYGTQGSLAGMSLTAAQDTLKDSKFGAAAQQVHPWPQY